MNQKAFYELPRPAKKNFAVVVLELPTEKDKKLRCSHLEPIFNKAGGLVGCLTCENDALGLLDYFTCKCCGRMFCADHIQDESICDACAKLDPEGIEKAVELRQYLNS